jgi:hypothetical protein
VDSKCKLDRSGSVVSELSDRYELVGSGSVVSELSDRYELGGSGSVVSELSDRYELEGSGSVVSELSDRYELDGSGSGSPKPSISTEYRTSENSCFLARDPVRFDITVPVTCHP